MGDPASIAAGFRRVGVGLGARDGEGAPVNFAAAFQALPPRAARAPRWQALPQGTQPNSAGHTRIARDAKKLKACEGDVHKKSEESHALMKAWNDEFGLHAGDRIGGPLNRHPETWHPEGAMKLGWRQVGGHL
eukprot:8389464-Pyramimonas_sp.AAC.1